MASSEDIRTKIEGYVRAFNARDIDTVASLYAENATLEDPVGSDVKHGRQAIRAFYEQYRDQPSFLHLTGDFGFPEGAVAFSFYCYMGDPADPMIVEVTDTMRFDERGLIKEMRAFWGMPNVLGVTTRAPAGGLPHPLAGQVVALAGSGDRLTVCSQAIAGCGATAIVAAPSGEAEAVAAGVRDAGGRAVSVSPVSTCEELQALAQAQFGRLDAIVDLSDRLNWSQPEGSLPRIIRVAENGSSDVDDARAQTGGGRINAPASVAAQQVAEAVRWLCQPIASGPVNIDLAAS